MLHSPQPTLGVRLPDLPCVDLQGSQPPATVAEGVDASDTAIVAYFAIHLGSMADDAYLA